MRILKNTAVLLSCIMTPVMLSLFYESIQLDYVSLNSIRFQIPNRVYAATETTSELNTRFFMNSKRIAPNIHMGHEISLMLSVESAYWNVGQQTFEDVPPEERMATVKFRQVGSGAFLRYSYNVPFSKHFGFFLGTTAGILFENMDRENFHSGYGVFFPTMLVGFTFAPFAKNRLTLATEYGATWYPEMTVYTYANIQKPLKATLDMWDMYISNDYFFMDDIAFSISGGIRAINNICKLPLLCEQSSYVNTLRIRNTTYFGQVGFVFGDLR